VTPPGGGRSANGSGLVGHGQSDGPLGPSLIKGKKEEDGAITQQCWALLRVELRSVPGGGPRHNTLLVVPQGGPAVDRQGGKHDEVKAAPKKEAPATPSKLWLKTAKTRRRTVATAIGA